MLGAKSCNVSSCRKVLTGDPSSVCTIAAAVLSLSTPLSRCHHGRYGHEPCRRRARTAGNVRDRNPQSSLGVALFAVGVCSALHAWPWTGMQSCTACAHFIFILRSRHAIVCSVHAWHYPLCHGRDAQLMPWSDSTSVVCAQSCLPCWATHPYCFFLSELEPHKQCMLRTGGHARAEHGSLQWASGLRSCSAS